MKPAHLYSTLRHRLKASAEDHPALLGRLRALRFALMQGPWQPLLIRGYQRWGNNPSFLAAPESLLEPFDTAEAVRRLERDAFAPGLRVPEATVDAIVRFMREDDSRRIDNPHHVCPEIDRLAHDPALVSVARGYLGAEPILLESRMYWTIPFPDERGRVYHAADNGQFHYDVVDVKSLSVFVYLTDVDSTCGPHVVIRGSQRRRVPGEFRARMLDDATAERRYGDRIQMITGPRGTAWLEDILCYHKQAIGPNIRLLLTIVYSLHRRPVREGARFDRLSLS
jgi:hypothetical protein